MARGLDADLQAIIGYALGSYALGYYTPPLPPGAGPELVPPQHALGAATTTGELGSAALLDAIRAAVAEPPEAGSDFREKSRHNS